MLGATHLLSGAVVGLLLAPRLGGNALPLAAAVGVAAGAALWPDIDIEGSSVARAFHLPGQVTANWVGAIAGGHRAATHSLLAVLAAGAGTYVASSTATGRQLLLFLLLAPALHVGFGRLGMLTIPVAVVLAFWLGPLMPMPLLTAAVVAGLLTHIVGDMLTVGGCPLFWPWPQRISLPLLGTTGGIGERLLMTPALMLLGFWAFVQAVTTYPYKGA